MTNYDDGFYSYNAPIPYNGVVVPPPTPVPGSGAGGFVPKPWSRPHYVDETEDVAVAAILAELLMDE